MTFSVFLNSYFFSLLLDTLLAFLPTNHVNNIIFTVTVLLSNSQFSSNLSVNTPLSFKATEAIDCCCFSRQVESPFSVSLSRPFSLLNKLERFFYRLQAV